MMKNFATLAVVTAAILTTGCGGGRDTAPTVDKSFKPTTTAANVKFVGTTATGAPVANTPITAYDAKGKSCGAAVSGSDGKFAITGKCLFPVLIAADTPDALGSALFAVVPTIVEDGESVPVNVTPMTTLLSYLVNGSFPTVGSVLSATTITTDKLTSAQNKLSELLKPVFTKLSISETQNFQSGEIKTGEGQDVLLDQITLDYEPIPSLGQKVIRIYFPSENRPIALVLDSVSPASMRLDLGLGVDPASIDVSRMSKAKAAVPELAALINARTSDQLFPLADVCFRHNGMNVDSFRDALFDAQTPWDQATPTARNFKLLRYNTSINFANTTEENINTQDGELAFFSFEFATPRGSTVKSYAWAVRGQQVVRSDCTSSGSKWKILGNQRDVYARTSAYSLHRIEYNSAFSGRKDEYGSGLELEVADPKDRFAYALLSGPGLASNGVVFLKTDGAFLYANTTPLEIRKAALAALAGLDPSVPATPTPTVSITPTASTPGTSSTTSTTPTTPTTPTVPVIPPKQCDTACLKANAKSLMTKIFDSVVDTRSILLNDQQIAGIPDAFYGNKYTVRVFENYEDLYPVFTLDDVLPKRPQLNSEMKPANYPSLDVNLDKLVSALQSPESVTANWSLPKDSRGLYLDSHRIGFQRKNCIDASKWPKCSKRSEQFNEFFFSSQFVPSGVTTASPTPVAPRVGKTVLSGMRLFVLDKSHRPMEVSILMNYAL